MSLISQENNALDRQSFRAIADIAYRESGLTLVEEKSSMIQSRLRHRLRELGFADFQSYCAHIASNDGVGERKHLVSALTTNVSHFFREPYHFDFLQKILIESLPALRQGGRFRLWSAGCSNGQEAVSAAITILDTIPESRNHDIRVLGTDIDPNVIKYARCGIYSAEQVGGISEQHRQDYFTQTRQNDELHYKVNAEVSEMIRFNELNLLQKWPFSGQFDVIFCRNVVIYFNKDTQLALWPRFKEVLAPKGMLFLGHSERILDPGALGFACAGQTAYQTMRC